MAPSPALEFHRTLLKASSGLPWVTADHHTESLAFQKMLWDRAGHGAGVGDK